MLSTTALIAEHHPAPPPRLPPPAITTGETSVVTRRSPAAVSQEGLGLLLPPDAGPPILKGVQSKRRAEMSGIEDSQDASEDDTREEATETAEDNNELASSTEESDSPDLSEKINNSKEEREKKEEEQVTKVHDEIAEGKEEVTPNREETRKEETSDSAELATITRSASSDDGVPTPVSGIAAYETRQAEPRQDPRTSVAPSAITVDDVGRRASGGSSGVAVGEWNSLPVLVERLREALELSLAAGCRRGSGDEPTSLVETGIGAESGGDRSRPHRRSLEQTLLHGCDHDDPAPRKEELKFLEDLLLSDIQTALARLRETLEHTNVATLAKYGGVSDPSSKLHLLRLVSSLLSRLQIPEQVRETSDARTLDGASSTRRRRAVRHTIGVSAEELAHARKQLEENSVDLARLNDQVLSHRRESLLAASTSYNATSNGEKHVEEIHDKYTKDVINQRQSLRDKNKDPRGDTIAAYPTALVPSQIVSYTDRPVVPCFVNETTSATQRRGSVDSYQEKESDDEEETTRKANEEQNRVTKLAAVLRQRAELVSAGKCGNGNKFIVKKSKIKRANTVDIPSYLKLQAEGVGSYDNPCILLRRPINVGDKVNPNTSSLAVVPSFNPKTENDKKFLALINRNNETQSFNATPAFVKSFAYTKTTTDMSSLPNENWNSRFSNIKTAFDKPSIATNDGDKLVPRLHPAKRLPNTPQLSPQLANNKKASAAMSAAHNGFPFANSSASKPDAGFKHAPSSLFRKIEKPQSSNPFSSHQRDNSAQSSGITLREKAKLMFDRDSNSQVQSGTSKFHASEHSQSTFPRPPWIEHDRNESKTSGNMLTENGRLDYRLFCKQFAPFIGKSDTTPEPKKNSQKIEESRKEQRPTARHKDFTSSNEKLGIVDGKISFRMFPERESQRVQRYRPSEPHRVELIRDKLDPRNEKDVLVSSLTRNDKNSCTTGLIDATLKGSSSVGIQTGANSDDHPEEARVFRVAPRTPRGPASTYNNASVQTQNEPEQWMTSRYGDDAISNSSRHPAEDPRLDHFVLDHNQNYRSAVGELARQSEISPLVNKNACDLVRDDPVCATTLIENVSSCGYHSPEQTLQTNPQYEHYFPSKASFDDRSQVRANYVPYVEPIRNDNQVLDTSEGGNFTRPNSDIVLGEQYIENQDISADAGIVTRYTCAIATVASADIPEARSEQTTGPESEASSSSSQLCPRSSSGEITTTKDDEIRRHNMLQQSLVRRLQNERATLNDYRAPVPDQPGNVNQPSTFHQSRMINQPSNFTQSNKCNPSTNFSQPAKFQPTGAANRLAEAPRKLEPPKILEPFRKSKPPAVIGLLSVAPSAAFSATNRVTALREQYEQPSDQTKPSVHKERSPIPNGSMDSSDEYLVSCVNKPCRSIVLSKSESWHQLALSGSQQSSSRVPHGGLPPPSHHPSSSHLLKPPKPKSPSSFKMKKQYEASSSSDSVKRMEDKIRRYFDNPMASDNIVDTRDSKGRRFSSRDSAKRGLIGLSRSRTLPGMCDERLHLTIPAPPQIPTGNLNTAEVEKVFDDIFEEATRSDDHRF